MLILRVLSIENDSETLPFISVNMTIEVARLVIVYKLVPASLCIVIKLILACKFTDKSL